MAHINSTPDTGDRGTRTASVEGWDSRIDTLALLLMVWATFGSSWSAYQSNLWNGVQTFRLMDAATLSRAAGEKTTAANQLRSAEASLFVEYVRDLYEGKTGLCDFILARMRPELRQAVRAWAATQPLKNPQAPATPFVMPEYRLDADEQARALEAESTATYDEGRKANRICDTYALLGVLFTSSLFLAGLVSGFDQRLTRRTILILSFAVILAAVLIMAQQPVAHRG